MERSRLEYVAAQEGGEGGEAAARGRGEWPEAAKGEGVDNDQEFSTPQPSPASSSQSRSPDPNRSPSPGSPRPSLSVQDAWKAQSGWAAGAVTGPARSRTPTPPPVGGAVPSGWEAGEAGEA